MPRELTSHKVGELNECLTVGVIDDPGHGNACHAYLIYDDFGDAGDRAECVINFQNGPVAEVGVNGVSIESLLAVAEDRLNGFQSGPYACRENAIALTKIQEAMMWLHKRTRDRIARGVEGTSEK